MTFGKTTSKRGSKTKINGCTTGGRRVFFFELPYWSLLLISHNLDVMHIEKNICDSILGTLLQLEGKSKDSERARLDTEDMGIRKDQHPIIENDKCTLPAALYYLDKDDKEHLCQFLHGVRMPDGVASNIRRCVDVDACKVSGLKTHDYHIILQKLLPLVVRKILPEDVVMPLIQLSIDIQESGAKCKALLHYVSLGY